MLPILPVDDGPSQKVTFGLDPAETGVVALTEDQSPIRRVPNAETESRAIEPSALNGSESSPFKKASTFTHIPSFQKISLQKSITPSFVVKSHTFHQFTLTYQDRRHTGLLILPWIKRHSIRSQPHKQCLKGPASCLASTRRRYLGWLGASRYKRERRGTGSGQSHEQINSKANHQPLVSPQTTYPGSSPRSNSYPATFINDRSHRRRKRRRWDGAQ